MGNVLDGALVGVVRLGIILELDYSFQLIFPMFHADFVIFNLSRRTPAEVNKDP